MTCPPHPSPRYLSIWLTTLAKHGVRVYKVYNMLMQWKGVTWLTTMTNMFLFFTKPSPASDNTSNLHCHKKILPCIISFIWDRRQAILLLRCTQSCCGTYLIRVGGYLYRIDLVGKDWEGEGSVCEGDWVWMRDNAGVEMWKVDYRTTGRRSGGFSFPVHFSERWVAEGGEAD